MKQVGLQLPLAALKSPRLIFLSFAGGQTSYRENKETLSQLGFTR